MLNEDFTRLERMIAGHEGVELKPYLCPAGKWTIGAGRNIQDRPLNIHEQVRLLSDGITKESAMWLLRRDIKDTDCELRCLVRCYQYLDPVRQDVLIDMAYNLGIVKLRGFKRMLAALEDHDFQRAAREMLDSKWAKQVGQRANTLALMMREGKYPGDIYG